MTIEEVIVGGVNTAGGAQDKDEIVYLILSEDLDSDDEPRIELDGSIMDLAGNERKKQVITRLTDRIGPTITVDPLSAQLLAAKGEATVSFGSDENLGSAGSSEDLDELHVPVHIGRRAEDCWFRHDQGRHRDTCLRHPTATYTFKQGLLQVHRPLRHHGAGD